MSYIVKADLDRFLSGLLFEGGFDYDIHMSDAFEEMELTLGEEYVTPLPVTGAITDPRTLQALVYIQSRLAAGQIVLYAAGTSGDEKLNTYGEYLITQARDRIKVVTSYTNVSARLDIASIDINTDTGDTSNSASSLGPRIANKDFASPVEAYYNFAATGACSTWYTEAQS